jgi:hypothetical protein
MAYSLKGDFQDYLEISCEGHSFRVLIKAEYRHLYLTFPEHLDFGTCPVNEENSITTQIKNMGKADAVFLWHVPEYFEIIPANGVLAPGQICELTVRLSIKVII